MKMFAVRAALAVVVGVSSLAMGGSDAVAGDHIVTNDCSVVVGYRYEWRCVPVRAGLFGCRTKYRAVCCRVPIYGLVEHEDGPNHGQGPDVDQEHGGQVEAGIGGR